MVNSKNNGRFVRCRCADYHIGKVYSDLELDEKSTIRKFRIVQTEGDRTITRDVVQFRKWVNQIAMTYTIKGWVMDDDRLKQGTYLTE